jgi:hypothetical protein
MRRIYGASAGHLLAHAALFVVAGWALSQALDARGAMSFAVWFVGAILLHDLVAVPAYSALDRGTQRLTGRRRELLNHLRLPAVIAGILFAAYFPLILQRGAGSYRAATGKAPDGYGEAWLAITAALFAASALIYAGRTIAGRRRSGP